MNDWRLAPPLHASLRAVVEEKLLVTGRREQAQESVGRHAADQLLQVGGLRWWLIGLQLLCAEGTEGLR